VDLVLLVGEDEQHDDEHDQRTLCGHVEAERELQDRYGVLVEGVHEHMDDVAEEYPHREMRQHQSGGPSPMSLIASALHRSSILPERPDSRHNGWRKRMPRPLAPALFAQPPRNRSRKSATKG